MASHRDLDDDLWRRLIEAFAQHERAVERHVAAFERHEVVFERHDRAFERIEGGFNRMEARAERTEAAYQESQRLWETHLAALNGLVRIIDDMREQVRANTQAALRLLDRFGEGGQAA